MAAKEDFTHCTGDLLELVTQGQCGRVIFEPVVVHIISDSFGVCIDRAVDMDLGKVCDFGLDRYQTLKGSIAWERAMLASIDLMPQKRKISVRYGETLLHGIEVASIM